MMACAGDNECVIPIVGLQVVVNVRRFSEIDVNPAVCRQLDAHVLVTNTGPLNGIEALLVRQRDLIHGAVSGRGGIANEIAFARTIGARFMEAQRPARKGADAE